MSADTPSLTYNDFGQVGLIEMPTARMAPDAELSANASFFKDHEYYNLGFQAFPWLETEFRYAGISDFDTIQYPVYWDRALSMKARLWEESPFLPTLAIGINATVGASVYQSEYLVTSKQFGPFDASLGIGWGRLATADTIQNPLCSLFSSFCARAPASTNGGNFNFGQYFHGQKAGLFGGLNWQTPIKDLTLQIEYSSDNYALEHSVNGGFNPRTQVNFGATYWATDSTSFGVAYVYGESIAGRVTFVLDPVHPQYPAVLAPTLPEPAIRSSQQQQTALNILLGSRQSARGAIDYAEQLAAENRSNSMADALFQEGISDARVQGREVVLAAPHPKPCSTYAELIGSYDSNLTAIAVSDTAAGTISHCAVSARPLLIRAHTFAPSMSYY